jgi:hypothetical protein
MVLCGVTQKDIRLARQTAAELQIPLPSATVADQLLTTARHLGYAHRDLASLYELLAHTAAESQGSESEPAHNEAKVLEGVA